MRRTATRRWARVGWCVVVALAVWLPASMVRPTPTDPFLAIRTAVAEVAGSTILRVEGSFHGEDLIQQPVPLQVLVRDLADATTYLRIDLVAGGVTGDEPALADGLQVGDVGLLLASGSPEPGASLVELSTDRLDVMLPASFSVDDAEVQLFLWNDGDPVVSNPLPVLVGGTP